MKILLICMLFVSQAMAQSHTGTGTFSDHESVAGGAYTCEDHVKKVMKIEKKFMLSADQPYKNPEDFLVFIDDYFLKENIKFLSISLPFTKLQPKCDCEDKSLRILKKILGMYKDKQDWKSCVENKERIERIPTIEKIIKYYDK